MVHFYNYVDVTLALLTARIVIHAFSLFVKPSPKVLAEHFANESVVAKGPNGKEYIVWLTPDGDKIVTEASPNHD